MSHLDPVEIRFLEKQIDIHLMEAYIALSNAAREIKYVDRIGSELDTQIHEALVAVNYALSEVGSDVANR